MIAITPTVLDWYRQQIAPPLAIFKQAESKQRRISIHTIININARLPAFDSSHHMGNTLAILSLRRKRSALTLDSLRMMQPPHRVTGHRIARAWERANSRKAV
ncbi:hypothetical protein CL97_gp171 [Cronobacter phage CR9]|uniref:Uncharacterized protein n=1 Tax=Cronobacter phage CR9 TaxID=1162290 RepID=M1F3M9_9CAUD|nr:hypothetical protein CL97_gp171 [Cronobacter phage CR9]AFH21055.1 hypothetical protein CR9_171 [Cronobacter phage CR9]